MRSKFRNFIAALALAGASVAAAPAAAVPYTEIGDAGSTPGTAQIVPGGVDVIYGQLSVSDFFLIGLSAGTYEINTLGGSIGDPMLFLYDNTGSSLLSFNDDWYGLQSRLIFTVASGLYLLGIDNYSHCYAAANMSCFAGDGNTVGGTPYQINISAATTGVAVPAPGAIALLALGLLAAGMLRRRA